MSASCGWCHRPVEFEHTTFRGKTYHRSCVSEIKQREKGEKAAQRAKARLDKVDSVMKKARGR